MQIDLIPIDKRACDLCNEGVTDESHTATRSFILTDWGVICIRCWDNRIEGHAEFQIVRVYVTSEKIEDVWIKRPLLLTSFPPDEHPEKEPH